MGKKKKLAQNLPSFLTIRQMEMYIFHICILPSLFYKLALRKYSGSCEGLT